MNWNFEANTCNPQRLEAFLCGDMSDVEEQELTSHLNTCEHCRRAIEHQAAGPKVWNEAGELLRPTDYFSLSDDEPVPESQRRARKLPLQIQSVLDALGPTDDPEKLGRLGPYEVSGVVGAGGMGVVLKAIDRSLDRTVAIKVLAPHLAISGAARKRFAREAKAAAAVLHSNVIAIHSVSHDEALPYLVMPYVRGTSLQKRLDIEGHLALQEILRIGAQVAAGLAAAHSQGLVHRDIKPANILLEQGVERVTITDFGLARAVDDASITHSGMIAGTPQYMSPEQARGEPIEQRSDLFSLGSVLYTASTGRPPFRAETSYGVIRKITDEQPTRIRELNPHIPDWFECIVSKLMEKDPNRRFSSAAELESLLKQCLAHIEQPLLVSLPEGIQVPQANPNRTAIFNRRSVMTVVALTLLAGFGWLLNTQLNPQESDNPSQNSKQNSREVKRDEKEKAEELGSTTAGDYRVALIGVGDVSQMQMVAEFDTSRMAMQSSFQETGNGFSSSFGNGGAGGNTAGFASGGGGGAGGGFGAVFNKPNFGIALQVQPLKTESNTFVELGSKMKAVDEEGQEIESQNLGPVIHRFPQFESKFSDSKQSRFLYAYRNSSGVPKLKSLEGELIVSPGRSIKVTFDGTKPQSKKVGGDTFILKDFTSTGHGLQISVQFPMLESAKKAKTPQEKFQAMIVAQSAYSAIIEDDQGDIYPSVGATNGGGNTQTSFTFSSNNGVQNVQGQVGSSENPIQRFAFKRLPDQRTIRSITVGLKDRTGEPETIPFEIRMP